MAYMFLKKYGWDEENCIRVKECISSHRYLSSMQPTTIEAKILLDADKLDMTGAIGIGRVLLYQGFMKKSIYCKGEDSFLNEYRERLLKVYDSFYTEEAKEIASQRKELTHMFYQEILKDRALNDFSNITQYIGQ